MMKAKKTTKAEWHKMLGKNILEYKLRYSISVLMTIRFNPISTIPYLTSPTSLKNLEITRTSEFLIS
jgi:hypothetical protein